MICPRTAREVSEGKITSHGPSGIGFVNFGIINSLEVKAPIEIFGRGARGFNVYSGTVRSAEFNRVVAPVDGPVGIRIGRPVGKIAVTCGIQTFGESLIKGVMTKLSAVALSVKAEGSLRKLRIKGDLITHGPGVAPLELQGGIESLQVEDDAIVLGQENAGSQSTKTN